MRIEYKNNKLEHVTITLNIVMSTLVVTTFVSLYGFHTPLVASHVLYKTQILLLLYFVVEKIIRTLNVKSTNVFWRVNLIEILFLTLLGLSYAGRKHWFSHIDPDAVWHFTLGLYLIFQIVIKICHTLIRWVSLGENPTHVLITTFVGLIFVGAAALSLPNASTDKPIGFIDALFTATSATCVTGLVVKDTGNDFTILGQITILTLIQLGGLGIVVFGAVFALLLRQAFSLRESVAIQDLLSTDTLSQLNHMINFVFIFTIVVEIAGTLALIPVWRPDPHWQGTFWQQQLFYSLFHSISAFCNAGFGLYDDSLIAHKHHSAIYTIIAPLIILGGLGFNVLYNLYQVIYERIKKTVLMLLHRHSINAQHFPTRINLQSKIVILVSFILICLGAGLLYIIEHSLNTTPPPYHFSGLDALFQAVTARTAGFNTVDLQTVSPASRMVLMILMFIGGSPGSTAGGIKTVTLAILIMAVVSTLHKRKQVELFKRSINDIIVRRVMTVSTLFIVIFLIASLGLMITERHQADTITPDDCLFETMSALGTVGLSTGITAHLSIPGKCIIILIMLFGRLGPLTLLAALTFDIQPVRYSYPEEAITVG